MLNVSAEPLVVGAFGAVCMEVVRWKQAVDRLSRRSRRDSSGEVITFPKWYVTITVLYVGCAAFICTLFPAGTNDLLYFYAGASLPKFTGTVIQAGEKLVPGAIDTSRPKKGRTPSSRNVDDTSVPQPSSVKVLFRTRRGQLRSVNGLFAFLTA